MADCLWSNVDRIQFVCWLVAGAALVPLIAMKSARVYAWVVPQLRQFHGALCECVFCDQLTELRSRVQLLEWELTELRQSQQCSASELPSSQ